MPFAEDERLAQLLLLLRRRALLSQATLAQRARVPRQDVQRVERGAAGLISLDRLRNIFEAVGGRGRFGVWWNGAAADRLLDERHASLVERVVGVFKRNDWTTAVEVSFSEFGERGSIDVLAADKLRRAIAVAEVKSDFGSLEETNRVLDIKERLAPKIAERQFGWRPTTVARILILADQSGNRRIVAQHQQTMAAIYPARGREIRAWLQQPAGPLRGIWFLSDARHRSIISPSAA